MKSIDNFFSNVFTPNNDGINDFFQVKGNLECDDLFHLQIFNRWGKLLFETRE
jgi:gliding motility-associated-like protein